MHVYTPPGYETGSAKYPVFYLLHGAGDSDDSWTSVGRAGFILDNLIADKKAKPMVVVMPAGHTIRAARRRRAGTRRRSSSATSPRDIVPYVAKNYRVLTDRANTAIAGLSMGGNQTLQIAHPAAREVRLHRRLQLRPARRVPRHGRPGGRGAAPHPAPRPPPPLPRRARRQRLPRAPHASPNGSS